MEEEKKADETAIMGMEKKHHEIDRKTSTLPTSLNQEGNCMQAKAVVKKMEETVDCITTRNTTTTVTTAIIIPGILQEGARHSPLDAKQENFEIDNAWVKTEDVEHTSCEKGSNSALIENITLVENKSRDNKGIQCMDKVATKSEEGEVDTNMNNVIAFSDTVGESKIDEMDIDLEKPKKEAADFVLTSHRERIKEESLDVQMHDADIDTRTHTEAPQCLPMNLGSKLEDKCGEGNDNCDRKMGIAQAKNTGTVNNEETQKVDYCHPPGIETKDNNIGHPKQKGKDSNNRNKLETDRGVTVTVTFCENEEIKSLSSTRKRKRLNTELIQLEKDEQPIVDPGNDPNKIQLNAFDMKSIKSNNFGRSKRQIKQTLRYDTTHRTYNEERKMQEQARRTGTGFLCPKCSEHLSFDLKRCYMCGLQCSYIAGMGVVVSRDRDHTFDTPITQNYNHTIINTQPLSLKPKPLKNEAKVSQLESSCRPCTEPVIVKVKMSDLPSRVRALKTLWASSNGIKPVADPSNAFLRADARECEACLELFASTYITGHRRKTHGLSPTEFGCPYCPSTFKSMQSRLDHITSFHPGKPHRISDSEKSKTKCYLYTCPFSKEPFIYIDLQKHLKQKYNTDIESQMDRLTCTCPFCLSAKKPKRTNFATVESLKEHLNTHHQGCSLIGKYLPIGNAKGTRPTRKAFKFEAQPEPKPEIVAEVLPRETTHKVNEADEMVWTKLSIDRLKLALPIDRSISQFSYNHEAMMAKIDEKRDRLNRQFNTQMKRHGLKSQGENNFLKDTDYIDEQRLYGRGLRERAGKAEQEKLEKLQYRENCDELNRKLQYENRGRKPTMAEIENQSLVHRPIRFMAGTRTRLDSRKECIVGENCDLCSGTFAMCIVTSEEIEKAEGDICKALPLPIDGSDSIDIPNPLFRRLESLDDIPDDRESPPVSSDEVPSPRQIATKKSYLEDIHNVNTIKNCLEFAHRYNAGLLNDKN